MPPNPVLVEALQNPKLKLDVRAKVQERLKIHNWYVFTNAKDFRTDLEQYPGIEKGAILQMGLADEGSGEYLKGVVDYEPDIIVVEGDVSVPDGLTSAKKSLVLKISERSPGGRPVLPSGLDLLTQLRDCPESEIGVVNLLPRKAEEAAQWPGFDADKASDYAFQGKKIGDQLAKYGMSPASVAGKSKEELLRSLAECCAGKRFVVLVGESSKSGEFRIPGSAVVLDANDVAHAVGNTRVVALICNSQAIVPESQSVSVVGRMWTDQARSFLRVAFDRRQPPSTAEYLELPLGAETPRWEKVIRLLEPTAPSSTSSRAVFVTTLVALAAPPPPSPPPPPPPAQGTPPPPPSSNGAPNDASSQASNAASGSSGSAATPGPEKKGMETWVVLLLVGLAGGCAREVLRWRRLKKKRRADLYLRFKFLAISAIEIALGGVTGVVFAELIPVIHVQYAIAFVGGAGFEEIVRQAVKLRIWRPEVPMGVVENEPASLLEFMRS